jgi:hypothetical protein
MACPCLEKARAERESAEPDSEKSLNYSATLMYCVSVTRAFARPVTAGSFPCSPLLRPPWRQLIYSG